MVDRIETRDVINPSSGPCSKFYVENGSKLSSIRDIFEWASKSSCLTITEFGTAIIVEGRVAEVCLRSTDTRGIYTAWVHSPLVQDQSPRETTLTKISGLALIDGEYLDILSNIGHQAW